MSASPEPKTATVIATAAEALAAGERAIGGKAFGLAKLCEAGANVPAWFVIPADGMGGKLDLRAALERLGPGPYAVRSSMVGEDSAQYSFAGQLDTFLHQRTAAEVEASVRRVWDSAFGERAQAYRKRAGLTEPPRVGVIVQRMIAGQVSGVLFTAHPVTGRRDQALLTAAWGLGEGIVGGHCNTDEYVWSHDGREVSATIADKDVQFVAAEGGGTREIEVPAEKRQIRCLSPAQVAKVCTEGIRIATAFGAPLDIELTFDGDPLYLLQARPITKLPAPPDGPRVVWDNSNIQESYCGVTTPLTFSFARAAYESVYEQYMRALDVPEDVIQSYRPVFRRMLGLVRGRVYYNINNWYRLLLILPSFGRNKQDMERMMGLETPVDFVEDQVLSRAEKARRLPRLLRTLLKMKWRYARIEPAVEKFQREFEAAYRRADRAQFKDASFSRLMEIRRQLEREMLENWATPIVNDFFVMMSNGRVRRLVERAVGAADTPRVMSQLMAGEEGIESTEPTRMLLRMARTVRNDPQLSAILRQGEPAEVLARLRSTEFQKQIDTYIDRYGDRVMGELKLETISLREDPSFIVHALRNYLDRPDLDPDELLSKERKLRAAAEAELADKLGRLERMKLNRALRTARRAVKFRENMRLQRTRAFGLYRDLILALGRRMHEAGRLDHPRDIFYLTHEELEAFHDGVAVTADVRPLIRVRKAEFAAYELEELPHRFETVGPVYLGNDYAPSIVHELDRDQPILRGTGCFPGIAEAAARVILSPKDDLSVNGRILVTLRTDPGWAPLFPTASGILVERGSTLSHSAILARELGIPAVVGVPNLLKIIRDGERLRLDGGAGTVERLDQLPRKP